VKQEYFDDSLNA